MTENDRIDISQPVDDMCQALDLEPKMVAHLGIDPLEVTATVYTPNKHGNPHINLNTKEPVTETFTFKVRT